MHSATTRDAALKDVDAATEFKFFIDEGLNKSIVASSVANVSSLSADLVATYQGLDLYTTFDAAGITANVVGKIGRLGSRLVTEDVVHSILLVLLAYDQNEEGGFTGKRHSAETALAARAMLLTLLLGPNQAVVLKVCSATGSFPKTAWANSVLALHCTSDVFSATDLAALDDDDIEYAKTLAHDLWASLADVRVKAVAPASFTFSSATASGSVPPTTHEAAQQLDAVLRELASSTSLEIRRVFQARAVELMQTCMKAGISPDRPALQQGALGMARADLLARAGYDAGIVDPADAFKSAARVQHPAMPQLPHGVNPFKATPEQLRRAAHGFVGGGDSFVNAAGMANPGASLCPELAPAPTHHIGPSDLYLPNHFLSDPTEPAAKLAATALEMVPTVNGFKPRAAVAKLPPLTCSEDLLIGATRLSNHHVAHGLWSMAVRLAHDSFVSAIVHRHRVQGFPWHSCRTLEAKYRLGMHTGRYSAWNCETSLMLLATQTMVYTKGGGGKDNTRNRTDTKNTKSKKKPKKGAKDTEYTALGKHTTKDGKPLCRNFARGISCTRSPCTYVHACPVCLGDHNLKDCPQADSTA